MWRRKKYFLTFFLSLLLWGVLGYIIYNIPPTTQTIIVFFGILFLALFFTLSLILANSRRGFLLAVGMVVILLLRFLGTFNILTVVLLLAFLLTLELMLSNR